MQLNRLYTYEELTSYIRETAIAGAPLTAMENIGTSNGGRDIYALHIGKGEKVFVYTAGVHGCENVNPNVLIKIVAYYAAQKEIPRDWRLIFVPVVNPDGYEIARRSRKQIRGNARGVDINRNFPCKSYVGASPASEPETKCLIDLFKNYTPLLLVDFHSRGKSVFYYRNALGEKYNQNNLEIAKQICSITGYTLEAPENENPKGEGGNTVQFFSEVYGRPAITVETLWEQETYPLDERLQFGTFEEIAEVPMVAAMAAAKILQEN